MYKKLSALISEVQNEVLFGGGVTSRTQLWQYAKYQQLEKELREATNEIIGRQRTLMDECMERVFMETTETALPSVVENGASFSYVSPGVAKRYINTEWAGVNYSTRIWNNANALASHIRDDMADMMVLGRSPRDIKRKLREDFNVGFYEADRLVRTEANHVYNTAAIERYKADGVKKVSYLIGHDERTCSRCRKYAEVGEYPVNEAPVLPAHPNCRCCYAPVVDWDDWGDEGEKTAGLTGGGENSIFLSKEDPLADTMGCILDSHPNEMKRILDEAGMLGVETVKGSSSISYAPRIGEHPPQLHVSEFDSYGAWLHEEKHMLDDYANGQKTMSYYMQNVDIRYKMEYDAYEVEIKLAQSQGETETADKLIALREEERRRIYGESG